MKNILNFDFTVDRDANTITVKREFDAGLPLVWDAFTKSEILDQWWGPHPWKAETKSMNFVEGGQWLYAMVGPDGERHWALFNYQSIKQQKEFAGLEGFSDSEGNLNTTMPQSRWRTSFSQDKGPSLVVCVIRFESLAQLEELVKMGFKEGFTIGLNQLEELLKTLKDN